MCASRLVMLTLLRFDTKAANTDVLYHGDGVGRGGAGVDLAWCVCVTESAGKWPRPASVNKKGDIQVKMSESGRMPDS
jgi:hypothetical protein